jgi:hypothetical protein
LNKAVEKMKLEEFETKLRGKLVKTEDENYDEARKVHIAEEDTMAELNPSHIMQVGWGFLASKTLLSAVELGLFSVLGDSGRTGSEIAEVLKLNPRAIPDFPDTLVALDLLDREGQGPDARYKNKAEGAAFLNRESPTYIGGILEMANARLYGFWGDLTEALQNGKPQNEIKPTGEAVFAKLYAEPARLELLWPRSSTFRGTSRCATSAVPPVSWRPSSPSATTRSAVLRSIYHPWNRSPKDTLSAPAWPIALKSYRGTFSKMTCPRQTSSPWAIFSTTGTSKTKRS